jgi:hypothetical protein
MSILSALTSADGVTYDTGDNTMTFDATYNGADSVIGTIDSGQSLGSIIANCTTYGGNPITVQSNAQDTPFETLDLLTITSTGVSAPTAYTGIIGAGRDVDFALATLNWNGSVVILSLSAVSCLHEHTLVTMSDLTFKQIKNIKAGDFVLCDKKTNASLEVARTIKFQATPSTNIWKIPEGLIGNSRDIICTEHPIWCNHDQNRIFPCNIVGAQKIQSDDMFYDIQFEDDCTFYANDVKVDSLPPYNTLFRLPLSLYKDKSKYIYHIYTSEDDPIRNKPLMTEHYVCN